MVFEDCLEFKKFLTEKLEEYKNIQKNDSEKKNEEKLNTNEVNDCLFETIKSEEGKTSNENSDNQSNIDNENENIQNKNQKIVKRKNYPGWILGTSIIGVLGIGLFHMFSKKK